MPYLVLMTVSIILVTIAAWRSRNVKLVPLYLSISGLIYVFEYVILVLFESYVYSPRLLDEPYFDSILGATVSDGFIIPSVGVCIAIFDLDFWWISLIALMFVGIEESFVYMNVYHHVWWSSAYTFINLLVYFRLAKWIWRLMHEEYQHRWVQFMIVYLCNVVVEATTVFALAGLFHLFAYKVNWFADPIRGHVALATLVVLIDSFAFTTVVLYSARLGWYVVVMIGVFFLNDTLVTAGMLKFASAITELTVLCSQAVVLFLLTRLRNIVLLQADGNHTKRN